MSSRHPIDEIFRDKLAQLSTEPPMHLWDKIDQTRRKRRRGGIYFRLLAGVALSAIVALGIWAGMPTDHPSLQHLPIPFAQNEKEQATFTKDQPASTNNSLAQTESAAPVQKQRTTTVRPKDNHQIYPQKTAAELQTKSGKSIELPQEINNQEETPRVQTTEEIARWHTPELPILAFHEQKATNAAPFAFNDPTDCAKFRKRPWKFFATFGGAIDLARRQMSPKDADAQVYVDTRENTELPFYTFSLDARASVISPIGLGLSTGLDYTQINEKFDYVDPDAERTEVITTEYGPNGEIIGADTVLIIGSREIITYNRYRILDIPLLANYEFDFTHFALEVKGGILINILSRQKGDFLSPVDMEPTSFTNDKPNAYPAFRQHIGIGYYGGMSFNYKLNGGFQLSFEPFFRVYPKSFTRSDFPVTQKYFLTGLKLGLKVPLALR